MLVDWDITPPGTKPVEVRNVAEGQYCRLVAGTKPMMVTSQPHSMNENVQMRYLLSGSIKSVKPHAKVVRLQLTKLRMQEY
jgi:hypothetical protein